MTHRGGREARLPQICLIRQDFSLPVQNWNGTHYISTEDETPMNTVRPMTNEDVLAYNRLCAICFSYTDDRQPDPKSPEELHRLMAVFDEKGSMRSAMTQNDLTVRYCGQDVRMAGIGGVVTDPAARGEGGIRALFEEGLPRLQREGFVLSALYPFSHRFYNKFGYEWICAGRPSTIHRGDIRKNLARAEEIVRVTKEDDLSELKEVYAAYIADKDMAYVRTEWSWKDLLNGTPWGNLHYCYLLRRAGRPVAYWVGRMGSDKVMDIKDLAWVDQEGCQHIFAMMAQMNELDAIRILAFEGLQLRHMLNEPYDLEETRDRSAMFRVVDAARALALLRAPMQIGEFTVGVTDAQIPANNGCFTVHCDGDTLYVTRDDAAEPDLTCAITGLSALLSGREPFQATLDAGLATLRNPKKLRLMAEAFPQRIMSLNTYF